MSGTAASGQIREQIGRIEGTLNGIAHQVDEARVEAKEAAATARRDRERLEQDIRTVKHDARGELQVITARLDKQDRAIAEIQRTQVEHGKTMSSMREPLQYAVALKRKVGTITLVLGSAAWVLWSAHDLVWQMLQAMFRAFFSGQR